MAEQALRDRYVQLLMQQIEQCQYPSLQMMERAERAIADEESAHDYVELLLNKLGQGRYPSPELLDRVSSLIDALDQKGRQNNAH